jgi:glutathione S-transferase
MIQLYWSPRSRSFSAIWLLEETGLPYERVLTDISTGAQKAPEYLAINPMGKVPGLKDGDAALGEAAAICAYIADRYPETKLAPAITDPLRARYLQWLFFSPSCIEPALIQLFTKLEVPASTGRGEVRRRPSTCSMPPCRGDHGFSAKISPPPTSCSAPD